MATSIKIRQLKVRIPGFKRAEVFADRRTKRDRTRQRQRDRYIKEQMRNLP